MISLAFSRKNYNLKNVRMKHLLYFGIFCVGAVLRFVAIHKNPVNNQEALILLGILKNSPETYIGPIVEVFVKIAFFLFGESVVHARLGSALAGSLIILTPWLFEKYWGESECIYLSILFAIDPFLIGNAIQLQGNSFALLLALIAVSLFLRKKILAFVLSFFLLMLAGGCATLLLIFVLVIFNFFDLKSNKKGQNIYDYLIDKVKTFSHQIKGKEHDVFAFFLIGFLVLFLSGTTISSLLDEFSYGSEFANQENYQPGLLLAALFSYCPFGLINFAGYLFKGPSLEEGNKKVFYAIIFITLLFIVLFPVYSILDLAWVSIPLSFLLSRRIQSISQVLIKNWKDASAWFFIVLTMAFSLIIIALKFISPYSSYTHIFQIVIGTAIILVIIFLMSYIKDFAFARDILIACSVWIFLILQVSIAWKSAGFGKNPEMEILWENGYFKDHREINVTVRNAIEQKYGTTATIQIQNFSSTNPAVEWEVGKYADWNLSDFTAATKPLLVITESGESLNELYENYLGQEFVVNEKPLWVNTPISSMATRDYWSWAIYRISPSIKEKNILWVNKECFIDDGEIGGGK